MRPRIGIRILGRGARPPVPRPDRKEKNRGEHRQKKKSTRGSERTDKMLWQRGFAGLKPKAKMGVSPSVALLLEFIVGRRRFALVSALRESNVLS